MLGRGIPLKKWPLQLFCNLSRSRCGFVSGYVWLGPDRNRERPSLRRPPLIDPLDFTSQRSSKVRKQVRNLSPAFLFSGQAAFVKGATQTTKSFEDKVVKIGFTV